MCTITKLLTIPEAADVLKVSTRSIYYLISMAEIDAIKVLAGTRVLAESVESFIQRQITEADL